RLELSRAAAAPAGLDRRAGLCCVAVAAVADVHGVVLDVDLAAVSRVLQRDLHRHGHVAALHGAAARAAEPPGAERVAAEEGVEDVGEGAEALEVRGEPARLETVVSVAVVD